MLKIPLEIGGQAPSVPIAVQQFAIPGANTAYIDLGFGAIVYSEISCPQFTVISKHYLIRKAPCTMRFQQGKLPFGFYLNLAGGLRFKMAGSSEIILLKGQFQLHYNPCPEGTICFKKVGSYHSFFIQAGHSFLLPLIGSYPELRGLQYEIEAGRPVVLNAVPVCMCREMLPIIGRLTGSNQEGGWPKDFVQWQVTELFLLVLKKISNARSNPCQSIVTPYDLNQIEHAAHYLINHPGDYHGIRKLSLKVGVNMYKLRFGFRQLYGTGIYEFVANARIGKAKELLLQTTLTVEDIAEIVGYKELSTFSHLFKRKTGLSPSLFREMKVRESG